MASTAGDSVVETRENIPLKNTGNRKTSITDYFCGLCSTNNDTSEDLLSGSKFICVAFSSITVIITIALVVQIYYGDYQVVPHGSVATDSYNCSKIGTDILKIGGNAVDAAIASAFCLAVVAPHLCSLDSPGQMLIYNHQKRLLPDLIDFTSNEISEKAATDDQVIPRLVANLAYVHRQYGKLAWKSLVQPAAEIARNGFPITQMLVQAMNRTRNAEDLFGHLLPNHYLRLEDLAHTLENIANIAEDDLHNYLLEQERPILSKAITHTFNNFDIYVPGTPSIGPLLLMNLKQLENFNFSMTDTKNPEYVYRVAEITQILYNDLRISNKFREGTSTNVATMDLEDNYVSLVMGLSSMFGSLQITKAGYILDTKIPKTNTDNNDNFWSRLPLIITDSYAICGRRLVFGTNDVAVASQIIMNLLVANQNIIDAIEAPRFHIVNSGNGTSIGIEGSHTPMFGEDVLQYLETLTAHPLLEPEPYLSTNIVEKIKDDLNSHSDSRGGGHASRF